MKNQLSTTQVTSHLPDGRPVTHVVYRDGKGNPYEGTHAEGKANLKDCAKPAKHVSKAVRRRDARLAARIASFDESQKRGTVHQHHKPGSNKK